MVEMALPFLGQYLVAKDRDTLTEQSLRKIVDIMVSELLEFKEGHAYMLPSSMLDCFQYFQHFQLSSCPHHSLACFTTHTIIGT